MTTTQDHPTFLAIGATTRDTGCFAEADRGTFRLSLQAPTKQTTLVGCRFDDPAGTMSRCLDVFAGRTPRTAIVAALAQRDAVTYLARTATVWDSEADYFDDLRDLNENV